MATIRATSSSSIHTAPTPATNTRVLGLYGETLNPYPSMTLSTSSTSGVKLSTSTPLPSHGVKISNRHFGIVRVVTMAVIIGVLVAGMLIAFLGRWIRKRRMRGGATREGRSADEISLASGTTIVVTGDAGR